MSRYVIVTVGKTHSGKSTFARALEERLKSSVVIDQDNHAEFIQRYYKAILPQKGPNTLKYAITKAIVDYAVNETDVHLIMCNVNRHRRHRLKLLHGFHQNGFSSILVYFNIPDSVLEQRIATSERSTNIFRSAASFLEVLRRQQAESVNHDVSPPTEEEADYLFVIRNEDDVQTVIDRIVGLVEASEG